MPKIKKIHPLCTYCSKEITGKQEDADGKPCCFKCYVPYRQQQAFLKRHEKDNEVINRLREPHFWCPKCKSLRADKDVNFGWREGVMCTSCSAYLPFRIQKFFSKKHKFNDIYSNRNAPLKSFDY